MNICSKYNNGDIIVKQERYMVDGKSILGIFSLNLLKNVEVIIESKNKNFKSNFYNSIQKWEVHTIN